MNLVDFIENSLKDMAMDKISSMQGTEISRELYGLIKGNEEKVGENIFELVKANAVVNTNTGIKAGDFDLNLILDWDVYEGVEEPSEWTLETIEKWPEETRNKIYYDIFYNFDALWMMGIYKTFPEEVAYKNCGCGMMKLKSELSNPETVKDYIEYFEMYYNDKFIEELQYEEVIGPKILEEIGYEAETYFDSLEFQENTDKDVYVNVIVGMKLWQTGDAKKGYEDYTYDYDVNEFNEIEKKIANTLKSLSKGKEKNVIERN